MPRTTERNVTSRRVRVESTVLIVLPAYNEENNVGGLLDRISNTLEQAHLCYRIIVVDDGSQDRTSDVLSQYSKDIPLIAHRHGTNQGLGTTIRDGLLRAADLAGDADIVITMDADETHAPGLMVRMVQMINEGRDVVIASRYQAGARVYGLSLSPRFMSYSAAALFRIVFPTPGGRDFTCGYRAYRATTLRNANLYLAALYAPLLTFGAALSWFSFKDLLRSTLAGARVHGKASSKTAA